MSKPAPSKYKTTNWKTCNEALKARGSLMIWLDRDMSWHGPPLGKRGRTPTFSDTAIQFCLTIKCLFNLALRQAVGMVQSLLKLAGLDWSAPDYSTPEASAGGHSLQSNHDRAAPVDRQHRHQDAGRR